MPSEVIYEPVSTFADALDDAIVLPQDMMAEVGDEITDEVQMVVGPSWGD
jgi:hypothetical protein